MKITYQCDHCSSSFSDENSAKIHEGECDRAHTLAKVIGEQLSDGWKPPDLRSIDAWTAGDKINLYRIVRNFFGQGNPK